MYFVELVEFIDSYSGKESLPIISCVQELRWIIRNRNAPNRHGFQYHFMHFQAEII